MVAHDWAIRTNGVHELLDATAPQLGQVETGFGQVMVTGGEPEVV